MIGLVWAVAWRLALYFGICYGAVEYINHIERKENEDEV